METEERKPKRMQSTLSPREKELERLKSLAVVSVLNKNFQEHTRPTSLLVNLSPSSSLTTNQSSTRLRSNSASSKKTHTHHDSHHRKLYAEKEIDEDHLVIDSPIDAEKEDLERRLSELEALYADSKKEIDTLREQNQQQVEILVLQDKLITQMSLELESTPQVSIDASSLPVQDLFALTKEVQELRLLKSTFEAGLTSILTQLKADDEKLQSLEALATVVKSTNAAQTEYIDTKVQTLLTQVLHKNEMISQLQQENEAQERQIQALKSDRDSSARSSYSSGRWKIPPASPPPSLPLPPIPSESRSILSELSRGTEIETAFDEAAYYKEFTDQLQERLSMSKEIDDLRVWEPSDFDEIQKKIDSETWSLDDHHKNSAFWKGMKKRLIK